MLVLIGVMIVVNVFLRNPELKEIKDPIPNPYEITCKGDKTHE